MSTLTERPSIDRFVDLFLAALVVHGKRAIWVRTEQAIEERRRMHALHEYLNKEVEAAKDSTDRDWLHFILRLRNHVAPSLIGSFDDLLHSIFQKITTIVSVDLTLCHYYRVDLSLSTAKWWLEHSEPRMRALAEGAADVYMQQMKARV